MDRVDCLSWSIKDAGEPVGAQPGAVGRAGQLDGRRHRATGATSSTGPAPPRRPASTGSSSPTTSCSARTSTAYGQAGARRHRGWAATDRARRLLARAADVAGRHRRRDHAGPPGDGHPARGAAPSGRAGQDGAPRSTCCPAGRLDLGVGVGWQREEYDAAGLDFARRGRLLDHTLEVCQRAVARAARRLRLRRAAVRRDPHDAQAGRAGRRADLGERDAQPSGSSTASPASAPGGSRGARTSPTSRARSRGCATASPPSGAIPADIGVVGSARGGARRARRRRRAATMAGVPGTRRHRASPTCACTCRCSVPRRPWATRSAPWSVSSAAAAERPPPPDPARHSERPHYGDPNGRGGGRLQPGDGSSGREDAAMTVRLVPSSRRPSTGPAVNEENEPGDGD